MLFRSCLCLGLCLLASTLAMAQSSQPAAANEKVGDSSNTPVTQPSPAEKIPIPSATALQAATKSVTDLFNSDLVNATTPQRQQALAQKMVHTGIETTDDPAGRFVLLSKAATVAGQAGDVDTAFAAIDELSKSFQIDAVKMKADTAVAMNKTLRTPEQRQALATQLLGVLEAAVASDRYDLVRVLDDIALNSARVSNDPTLIRDVSAKVQQAKEAGMAYAGIKAALLVLAKNPSDPDANLKVGRFRCFFKGDWDGGLPMLALGNDATLKALAGKELAGANDAKAQVALGDGWWAAAETHTGPSKLEFQKRAGKWYSQAVPALTGFAKVRVENRLNSLSNVESVSRVVNVLKLVDTTRDVVDGKWEFRDGALVSDGAKHSKLEIPYQPPTEYDYKVVFARTDADEAVVEICWAMGRQFVLAIGGWKNTIIGFEKINWKGADENQTTRRSTAWLVNGRRYTSLIKVRKDRVQAYLDGTLITEWKTDYSDISLWDGWQLHRSNTIGFGTPRTPTKFYSAEVIEITGMGKVLK